MLHSKWDFLSIVTQIVKKYRNYLIGLFVLLLVLFVLWIWLVWTLFAGALSLGSSSLPELSNTGISKVQEVWINGIVAEPIQFLQNLWYGADGK